MIPPTRTLAFMTLLAFASTCVADVNSIDPTAPTRWTIGGNAEIHWTLTSPTAKTDIVDIYLVGGDYAAFKRIADLGKDITLGNHKLVIDKVPDVSCGSTCAIEFVLKSPGQGDYYSHNFTIAAAGASTAPASSNSTSLAGKVTSVNPGSTQPNGPTTMLQNTAKGAQPQAANNANRDVNKGASAMWTTVAMGVVAYLF
ncbi:hypothetical protein BGZ49_005032 [Haplosporangium sp. Z 27]|nr:hypothetical protein BGZ49_005032 [Haplosporangium sp. Z 27]